jgi:hypothetical protein
MIQSFTINEKLSPIIQKELDVFDAECKNRLTVGVSDNNTNYYLQDVYPDERETFDIHQDPDEPYESDAAQDEDDEYPDQESYDRYITVQVLLPQGDTFDKGTVLHRKRDAKGNNIGRSHHNPILDTRVYEVPFSNGHVAEYATNVIAENIYSMIDDEGYEHMLFKDIIDHRCDRAVATSPDDAWATSHNGDRIRKRTNKGWELCVEWSDGTTSWLPLRDLKNSNGVQVAEYAVAHNLSHEPAFSWWIMDMLKKRD